MLCDERNRQLTSNRGHKVHAQQTLPDAVCLAGLEEALVASLADAEGADATARAPPASKRAVKSLIREQLTEQRLQQLGGDGVQCAVCRSDLAFLFDSCSACPCQMCWSA